MIADEISIDELAASAGVTRRAVRFYVQQGLLPAPVGRGRGSHYQQAHLDRLRRIVELQLAGHSLTAIAAILEGKPAPTPAKIPRPATGRVNAELWSRHILLSGVELHYDAARHAPDPADLLRLRALAEQVFGCQSKEE